MANRGQRVNGSADGLGTLSNRSIVLEFLYDNLWYAERLPLGVLEQLVDGAPELTEQQKTLFLEGGSVQKVRNPKC